MPNPNKAIFHCLCCLLLCFGPSLARAQADFEAARAKSAAANPPGVTLTLALTGSKTVFHCGEIIPLSAVFTSDRPNVYRLDTDLGSRDLQWGGDSFQVDNKAGASDPLLIFYSHEFGRAYSGPGPQFRPLAATPLPIPYTLNEWLRFDKPGRCRVFLITHRIVDLGKREMDSLFFEGRTAVSNTVTLDILPDDPAWDARMLQSSLPLYNKDTENDYRARASQFAAARSIRFLGTPDAVRAMIARYGTFSDFDFSNTAAYFQTRLGLFGFAPSSLVIDEMERRLAVPGFPVSAQFIYDLAEVQFLAAYPQAVPAYMPNDSAKEKARQTLMQERSDALGRMYEQGRERLAAAVSGKQGRAQAISRYALLQMDYRHQDTAAYRSQARGLVPVFDDLTPEQQGALLDGAWWKIVRGPEMLPILRRFYAEPSSNAEPGGGQYDDARQRRSLVLRRIRDLSPIEGRTLLLAEIKNPKTQVDLPTLCSLPDKTLPKLDSVLVTNLENSIQEKEGDSSVQSRLVQRYATAAILSRLKAEYRFDGCAVEANLLAYFLRNDPAYGTAQLKLALVPRTGYGCPRYVLGAVAALRYGPSVERLAIAHLHDPDVQTAADAAKTLGFYGSPAAEAALWVRMREWHRKWAGKDVDSVVDQSQLQYALTLALTGSPHWLLNAGQLKILGSLCVSPAAKQNMEALARSWTDPVVLTYGGERDQWILVQYDSLSSFGVLEAKLAQFPRGTRFVLSRTNFADEAEQAAALRRLAPFLKARGMRITAQTFPAH